MTSRTRRRWVPDVLFGFAGGFGYQTDAESALQLLGHGYYGPSLGRFLTRDPIQYGRNWCDYHSCRFDLPAGGSVTHNYDSGALASEVDAEGFPENYGYDINRNLSRTSDRRGFSWYADCDWRGNVTKTFSPLRPPAIGVPPDESTYNLKDQVLTHKDGVWRTTKYEYDLKGNLLKVRDDLDNLHRAPWWRH